jgi:hypothetical protein
LPIRADVPALQMSADNVPDQGQVRILARPEIVNLINVRAPRFPIKASDYTLMWFSVDGVSLDQTDLRSENPSTHKASGASYIVEKRGRKFRAVLI